MLSTISFIALFVVLFVSTVITVLALRKKDEAVEAFNAEYNLNDDLLHKIKLEGAKLRARDATILQLEARCTRLYDAVNRAYHANERRNETISEQAKTIKNLVSSHEMLAAALEDYNIDNAKRVLGGEFVPECADSLSDYALDIPLFSD